MAGTAQVRAQNVGIGTLHPQQKLHVAGGLRVDTLSNGKDSGLVRHNADGTVFSLAFSGDSTQVLRGNGTFGPAATAVPGVVTPFAPVTNPWLLGGNAGVTPATNFLGTTDNAALRFRINNQWAGMLDSVSQNTFFGYGAGKNDTALGTFNTAVGMRALSANTTGIFNTVVGWNALPANTSGTQNTAVGVQAMQSNTTGGNNVAVGLNSMNVNSTGSNNTAVGVQALNFNGAGNFNTAVGRSALFAGTGNENVAMGHLALAGNGPGSTNSAFGSLALSSNTTGFSNVAIGTNAMQNSLNAADIVAIGDSALFSMAMVSNGKPGPKPWDIGNTAVGSKALFATTTGTLNTGVGFKALLFNITGTENTALGMEAMIENEVGSQNTAVGAAALTAPRHSNNNTAVGFLALGGITGGSDNTAIGHEADVTPNDTVTNSTVIGSGALVGTDNTVQLGNSATVLVSSTGNFVTVSDGRFKSDIREDVRGLDFILRLRPVSYQFDGRMLDQLRSGPAKKIPVSASMNAVYEKAKGERRTGFIAQEVEKAAQDCGYEFAGVVRPQNERDHYSLNYQAFVMPVVKAIQEQQKEIADLRRLVEDQRRLIDQLLHR